MDIFFFIWTVILKRKKYQFYFIHLLTFWRKEYFSVISLTKRKAFSRTTISVTFFFNQISKSVINIAYGIKWIAFSKYCILVNILIGKELTTFWRFGIMFANFNVFAIFCQQNVWIEKLKLSKDVQFINTKLYANFSSLVTIVE